MSGRDGDGQTWVVGEVTVAVGAPVLTPTLDPAERVRRLRSGGATKSALSSHPSPPRSGARRYAFLLLVPLALGLALRIGLAVGDNVITNDASVYMDSGRNLVDGQGFARDGGFPELHFPPVAPVLLGATWKATGSPLFALAFVNLTFSFLALLPLAALARRLGGDRAGLAACWIGALAPGISSVPVRDGGGSESIFLTLLLTGLWLVSTLPTRRGAGVWGTAGLAGLSAGALYLTRPEGLFLVLVMVGVAAVSTGVLADLRRRTLSRRRLARQLAPAAMILVVVAACMAPYLAFLHSHTGRWEMTAKSRDANIEAWQAVARGDRRARDEQLYELDTGGLDLVERSTSLAGLARQDPGGYAEIVASNAGKLRSQYIDPRASSPTPFPRWAMLPLPLIALALWAAWRTRREGASVMLIGVVAVATATCLGFFVQARYLIPVTGALCVLAGVGLVRLPPSWLRRASYGAVVLLALPILIDVPRTGGVFDNREPVEHQRAGEWIEAHTPEDSRIMTRSLVTKFYASRTAVALPFGSIDETVRFARRHGVDYLVIDEFLAKQIHPQLSLLVTEDGPWPGLTKAHELTYRGRLTRIFELTPRPLVDSPEPPRLGFVGDR